MCTQLHSNETDKLIFYYDEKQIWLISLYGHSLSFLHPFRPGRQKQVLMTSFGHVPGFSPEGCMYCFPANAIVEALTCITYQLFIIYFI